MFGEVQVRLQAGNPIDANQRRRSIRDDPSSSTDKLRHYLRYADHEAEESSSREIVQGNKGRHRWVRVTTEMMPRVRR
jgi:hypothetical protein